MTNKSNLREMGKPLAGKLMEDCVMITNETPGSGVREPLCVCVLVKERDKETKEQGVCIGEQRADMELRVQVEKAISSTWIVFVQVHMLLCRCGFISICSALVERLAASHRALQSHSR